MTQLSSIFKEGVVSVSFIIREGGVASVSVQVKDAWSLCQYQ